MGCRTHLVLVVYENARQNRLVLVVYENARRNLRNESLFGIESTEIADNLSWSDSTDSLVRIYRMLVLVPRKNGKIHPDIAFWNRIYGKRRQWNRLSLSEIAILVPWKNGKIHLDIAFRN